MVLKPRLAAEHMTTVYETLERPMVGVLGDMERAGVKVDRSILARLTSTFSQRIARLETEIYELAGTSSISARPGNSANSCSTA